MVPYTLPFKANSPIFRAFQNLWYTEVREELTYKKAQEYGPKILALIGAIARAKKLGLM